MEKMNRHKNISILNNTEILLILLVWLVLLISPVLFHAFTNNLTMQNILLPMQVMAPLFILFLINRFVLVPRFLYLQKRVSYIVSVVVIIGILMSGVYVVHQRFFSGQLQPPQKTDIRPVQPPPQPPRNNAERPFMQDNPPNPKPLPPYLNFLIFSILLVGFDTGLKVSFSYFKTEQEKARLEQENIRNQLAFLRNQVSPHFFMNTLNNIHALIDVNTEEAKTAIIKLSRLMRHLLYDSNAEFTPLFKEVEFINSYINLMKLRFPEKVKISVDIPDNLPDKPIPPLLFTSLIENAFKHGISYNSHSFIHLMMSFDENRLHFEIQNSNPHYKGKKEKEGIGLENTRKRLDLIYKGNYDLQIAENEETFIVILNLPL